MTKSEAQVAIKSLYSEASNLESSALITLFEIDISNIGFERGLISQTDISAEIATVFRFHNNIKLTNSSICWRGKEYVACPIQAEGFEVNLKGTFPTPKLSITVSDDGISALSQLKDRLRQLGDLTGAKVTRIRTYAKFIDAENFYGSVPPNGFSPNPGAEFPRDIFYVDRKSREDKISIEYELGSSLDVGDVKLPARQVVANSCVAQYRGAGCMFEYNSRRIEEEHVDSTESNLPSSAPPVANEFDERFFYLLSGVTLIDRGAYDPNQLYNSGDFVFITQSNINYYYVANGVDINIAPPNQRYWIQDACSKRIKGCELRYALGGAAQGVALGNLPYVAFPAVTRFK